ncbi:MAG: hypothetical protein Q7S57_01265 [bacterium]|nr:hypothetical protein [bacterium]
MRKSTRNLFLYGIMGALFGGIIIVLVLSMIGAGNRATVENKVSIKPPVTGTPNASSVVQLNTPTPISSTSPSSIAVSKTVSDYFSSGKFSYSVPVGYRVASKIVAMDEKNSPKGFSALTITKGTEQQESDYVNLVNRLQGGAEVPPANELPQFLPGQTISLYPTSKNAEDSDAKLSKGQEKITTAQGISGTRYVRVEGSTPYDVVYLKLADGRLVAVQMSYGSEEPLFDETAFMALVDSITTLK